ESELIEDFEGGGVDGVAAKVAVEVVMRFEQDRGHPGPGEQQSEDDAPRPAADDDAARLPGRSHRIHGVGHGNPESLLRGLGRPQESQPRTKPTPELLWLRL